MDTSLGIMATWSGRLARLVIAVALTLVLGSMLAPESGAIKKHGGRATTSIAERVESQGDLCFASGGTFTSGTNEFGTNVTTCSGGRNEQKCVNTKKNTYCEPLYTPPPPPADGVITQPPSNVGNDPDDGPITTGIGGASGMANPVGNPGMAGSRHVSRAAADGAHDQAARHGKHHQRGHGNGRKG
jgi:hypothetical protein